MNINTNDLKSNPNLLGETLRFLTFTYKPGQVGGYSHFERREDFKKLDKSEIAQFLWDNQDEIECGYLIPQDTFCVTNGEWEAYWDLSQGDGILIFKLYNWYLMNDDCKKDHGWKFITHE